LPQIPHTLHRWQAHQHHRPAALQRDLRVCCRHTILGCQRAICRKGMVARGGVKGNDRWVGLRPLTCSGYPLAHDPGVRPLTQPAPPRDLCDDRHLAGGEAAQGGGRGRDRPGGRAVLVPGEPEWSLKVAVRDLDRVVPGARGLILCSPCNPTGAVYTQAEIKAIAHWARDRKVWIVADEIYRRIHYGTGPSPSF